MRRFLRSLLVLRGAPPLAFTGAPQASFFLAGGCLAALLLAPASALAAPQADPAAPPPPAEGPAAPAPAPEAPPPPEVSAPAAPEVSAAAAAPAPAPAADAPAPPAGKAEIESVVKGFLPRFSLGVRVGGTIQGESRDTLDGFYMDTIYAEPRLSGDVTTWLKWQVTLSANANKFDTAEVRAIDVYAQFDVHEAANLWVGKVLVPTDRSNFAGPFYMIPWNYPGSYGGVFLAGTFTDPMGRDTGGVAWGEFLDGKLKYHLGAFGLENLGANPRFAGRLSVALVGSEPGFFMNSTYLGEKDIVALGSSFQYQKDGERAPPLPTGEPGPVLGDLAFIMADLLIEKKLGENGVATLEGGYYHYDSHYPIEHAYFGLVSYLFPWELGVGKLQPSVRLQQAFEQGSSEVSAWVFDACVNYWIKGFDARLGTCYQRQQLGDMPAWNAIQIGVQVQHFN